jgi:RimJ/RimL family protein N-acetyltransferase
MEYANAICINFTAEITRYMWPSAPKTQEEINQHILLKQSQMKNGEEISMIITDKESGEFLGYASIHQVNSKTPELGIWLKKEAHGHHYGYEAMLMLKTWLSDNLQYDYIKYPVDKNNIPSCKIAEKMGGKVEDRYIKISESGNKLDEIEYRFYKKAD